MGNSKGDRGERELRKILVAEEFAVIRAAGSGSAPIDLPDLHVANGVYEWAIEVKRHKGHRNEYLTEEEVDALLRYCETFPNARPRAAVRWDRDTTWYLADPRDLPETDSGNRVLDPDARDADYYSTLDALLSE